MLAIVPLEIGRLGDVVVVVDGRLDPTAGASGLAVTAGASGLAVTAGASGLAVTPGTVTGARISSMEPPLQTFSISPKPKASYLQKRTRTQHGE